MAEQFTPSIRISSLSDSELLALKRTPQNSGMMQEAFSNLHDKMDGNIYRFDVRQPWYIPSDKRPFDPSVFAPQHVMTSAPVKAPSPAKLRAEQLAKDRCQTIAKMLWKQNPNLTIAELTRHPMIRDKELGGGQFYEPRTVYDWIAEIKNHPQKNKRGRPRKLLK